MLFMQTAPSPLPGPRPKLLSLCQLIRTCGSPEAGVGQGPVEQGSRESASCDPHQALGPLTLNPHQALLPNGLCARHRSHLEAEVALVRRWAGAEGARTEGAQEPQSSPCGQWGVPENFQSGVVRSREVPMPVAGCPTETQLSPGEGGRQFRL